MADTIDRLCAVLADRSGIELGVGEGGMATACSPKARPTIRPPV